MSSPNRNTLVAFLSKLTACIRSCLLVRQQPARSHDNVHPCSFHVSSSSQCWHSLIRFFSFRPVVFGMTSGNIASPFSCRNETFIAMAALFAQQIEDRNVFKRNLCFSGDLIQNLRDRHDTGPGTVASNPKTTGPSPSLRPIAVLQKTINPLSSEKQKLRCVYSDLGSPDRRESTPSPHSLPMCIFMPMPMCPYKQVQHST